MEAYEVNATFQMAEQLYESICVFGCVIKTFKHSVFETDTPLSAEIIFRDQTHNLGNRPGLLHRHYGQTLLWERIVQTHSQMAAAFLKIALQVREHTYCGYRDSFGTPGKAPIGS